MDDIGVIRSLHPSLVFFTKGDQDVDFFNSAIRPTYPKLVPGNIPQLRVGEIAICRKNDLTKGFICGRNKINEAISYLENS